MNTVYVFGAPILLYFSSQPVPEELQNGDGFGYIIALRLLGELTWTHIVTSAPGRYVYRNESIPPFSPFTVKVGAYNVKGQGPFSPATTVFSAEEGECTSCTIHTTHTGTDIFICHLSFYLGVIQGCIC